ncbi:MULTISPECIES: hypothetical protein [Flammeovirga]|uniref:Uncharacterized protein n=1 Tax=Flammeovirga agarivorans TaxID=2726742 RepID=A0A7X8SPS5_9BACT|nr:MULTISPECIES: hypothetical protein [Flammeovirga]NLR94146.1 hypothetical protein [Flammeovirga agarivorans]
MNEQIEVLIKKYKDLSKESEHEAAAKITKEFVSGKYRERVIEAAFEMLAESDKYDEDHPLGGYYYVIYEMLHAGAYLLAKEDKS